MQWRQLDRRPRSITIIAVLYIVSTPVQLTIGVILLATDIPTAIFMLAMAPLNAYVAYGLLKGKRWAWILTVIITIVNIASSVINLSMGGGLIPLVINAIILIYISRPTTRGYFGKAPLKAKT